VLRCAKESALAVQRFVSEFCENASSTEKRRFALWVEEFGTAKNSRDIIFRDDRPFLVSVELLPVGDVVITRTAGSFSRIERRGDHARRNRDSGLSLVVNQGSSSSFAEAGARSVTIAPGGAVLLDPAQENIHAYPQEHRALALHIPRRHLVGALRQGENLNAVTIPADNEALRLLTYYASGALENEVTDRSVAGFVSQNLIGLTLLALGANRDDAEVARCHGLRAARLGLVLRLIRDNFSDPDISPDVIAKLVGISVRYLHDLLHETGASFSERVQELRLAKAFALLTDAAHSMGKVSAAAYEAGFNDLSHFNRTFRRKYGLTPTAARGRHSTG
jgi:AraC-like DNA-binding protein